MFKQLSKVPNYVDLIGWLGGGGGGNRTEFSQFKSVYINKKMIHFKFTLFLMITTISMLSVS